MSSKKSFSCLIAAHKFVGPLILKLCFLLCVSTLTSANHHHLVTDMDNRTRPNEAFEAGEPEIVIANICPPPADISPCICSIDPDLQNATHGQLTIFCGYAKVTEDAIYSTVRHLQSVNGIKDSQPQSNFNSNCTTRARKILYVYCFIQQTLIEVLDISKFFSLSIKELLIRDNLVLSHLVIPSAGQLQQRQQIRTNMLDLTHNNLTDKHIKVLLSFVDGQQLEDLRVDSISRDSEAICGPNPPSTGLPIKFIEQISKKFQKLWGLDLHGYCARILEGSPFRRLGRLKVLSFQRVGNIHFGKDAFLFDDDQVPSKLYMLLAHYDYDKSVKLNNNNFDDQNGLGSLRGGNVTLDLSGNNFQFLAQNKFEPFLAASQNNRVYFHGLQLNKNGFLCTIT